MTIDRIRLKDTREVKWAMRYALEKEAWIPVIALSEFEKSEHRSSAGTSFEENL